MSSLRTRGHWIVLALFVIAVSSCRREGSGAANGITVFAAASLTDAITELGAVFERKEGVPVHFNFAGTNALRDQILYGASADVFLSANSEHMDAVEKAGLLVPATRVDLLSNRLVLVAQKGRGFPGPFPTILGDPKAIARIGIAQPDSVPAGIYGAEALTNLGLRARVEPRLIPALDVRAVLAYVESGNIDVGIVYATDASISTRVEEVYEFPRDSYTPIRYPVAVLGTTRHEAAARAFLDFLGSRKASDVFRRYGFTPIEAGGGN